MIVRVIALGVAALGPAAVAGAQLSPSAGAEITSQEVRRGLSWSDRKASASADTAVPLGGLDLSARVAALRGAARHDDSDAVADLAIAWTTRAGGLSLTARGVGHVFLGGGGPLDYAEVGGSAAYVIGPLQFDGGAMWAPRQRAIGGSNLYLFVNASAGLPGTPFAVSAGAGHSSGGRDGARTERLRPGGDYADWHVGLDRVSGPLTLGLEYTGTDAPGHVVDARDRILARARLSF